MKMLSEEDKILIKTLLNAGRSVAQIIAEFPERNFKKQTLSDLVRKINETGSTDRRPGSGRPATVNTEVSL